MDELKDVVEGLVKADLGNIGKRIGEMVESIMQAGGALFSKEGREAWGEMLTAAFNLGAAKLKVPACL